MARAGIWGRGLESVHTPPVGMDDSCLGCWFSVSARPYRGRALSDPAQASRAATHGPFLFQQATAAPFPPLYVYINLELRTEVSLRKVSRLDTSRNWPTELMTKLPSPARWMSWAYSGTGPYPHWPTWATTSALFPKVRGLLNTLSRSLVNGKCPVPSYITDIPILQALSQMPLGTPGIDSQSRCSGASSPMAQSSCHSDCTSVPCPVHLCTTRSL